MKKVIMILILFFLPMLCITPVRAASPAQQIQWLPVQTTAILEKAHKAFENAQLAYEKATAAMKDAIQWAHKQYTAAKSWISAKLDWAASKFLQWTGLDKTMTKTQTNDETEKAKESDKVKTRVKENMTENFKEEAKGGAEAENETIKRRKAIRQENNIDKLSRLLVLKQKLADVAKEIEDLSETLGPLVDKVNSKTATMEEVLKENLRLRLAWYNLLALQLQIETHNLDVVASEGLSSMNSVNMKLEYKEEYQVPTDGTAESSTSTQK